MLAIVLGSFPTCSHTSGLLNKQKNNIGKNGMLRHSHGGEVFEYLLWHSLQVLLENLLVLLESDINLSVRKYSVWGNFSGGNTFSKIVALIV